MSPKAKIMVGSFAALAIAIAALVWVPSWSAPSSAPGINTAAYERLAEGMTLSQVRDLFGVPEGDYGPGELPDYAESQGNILYGEYRIRVWRAENVCVTVFFDDNDIVREKELGEVSKEWLRDELRSHPPRSVIERVRRWFL